MTFKRAKKGSARRACVLAAALGGLGALLIAACSNSGSPAAGSDGGGVDGACGPLPESLGVSGLSDCVATVPNPCCAGFHAFACAAGDGGGSQCSETSTCVRASRYDQSLCAGAQAYSCPDLNGTNYATMTAPSCQQMEVVGPAGEGIRWCCGSNLPPPNLDASAPPPVVDAAVDSMPPPGTDSGAPDSGPPDSGSPASDATAD
jgi:hypothetical protein